MKPIIVLTASEHTELGFRTWNHTAEAIWSHDLSLFFVLSGEVTFRLSEQFHTLTTGSMISAIPAYCSLWKRSAAALHWKSAFLLHS